MAEEPTLPPAAAPSKLTRSAVGAGSLGGISGVLLFAWAQWADLQEEVAELRATQSAILDDVADAKTVLCLLAESDGIVIPECRRPTK